MNMKPRDKLSWNNGSSPSLIPLLLILFIFLQVVNGAISPIVVKGSHFFHENGTQFHLRAAYYVETGRAADDHTGTGFTINDLLTRPKNCARDLPFLKALNVNAVYVEQYDARLDHSECMKLFAEAGIYVLAVLNVTPWDAPVKDGKVWLTEDWTKFNNMGKMIDDFALYPNTAGFIIHLESSRHDRTPTHKMWIKWSKDYIRKRGLRPIPVGFMGWSHSMFPMFYDTPNFMNCGKEDESADFYGLGTQMMDVDYCFDADYMARKDLIGRFRNYSKPMFLEIGCQKDKVHDFSELQTIFGNEGQSVFSGFIVEEWMEDTSHTPKDMGLIEIGQGGIVNPRKNYLALSSQIALLHPSSISMDQYEPTNMPPSSCSTLHWNQIKVNSQSSWTVGGDTATNVPHAPSANICGCMMQTLHCVSNVTYAVGRTNVTKYCTENWDEFACRGITNNYTTGVYGSYGLCTFNERLSWVANQMYLAKNQDPAVCTSAGGTIQTPVSAKSRAPACKEYLRQVGPSATGLITATPLSDIIGPIPIEVDGNSLSTGAKVGIGVSLAILILLLIAFAIWLRFRRIAARKAKENKDDEAAKTGVSGSGEDPTSPAQELEAEQRHELLESDRIEIGVGTERAELSAIEEKFELESPEKYELDSPQRFELEGSIPPNLKDEKTGLHEPTISERENSASSEIQNSSSSENKDTKDSKKNAVK